ncbi:MAG: hypothetical protein M3042_01090 [Actinomycetota bacterium]|nr:hypothetical protein [Actinomycetota bacterium]
MTFATAAAAVLLAAIHGQHAALVNAGQAAPFIGWCFSVGAVIWAALALETSWTAVALARHPGESAALTAEAVGAFGRISSLRVAAAALAAAALFQRLRRRVQALVDRRFNRARYNAERTVEAFRQQLRSEVDLGAVRDDLLTVVHRTVEPAIALLWLAPTGRSR